MDLSIMMTGAKSEIWRTKGGVGCWRPLWPDERQRASVQIEWGKDKGDVPTAAHEITEAPSAEVSQDNHIAVIEGEVSPATPGSKIRSDQEPIAKLLSNSNSYRT